MDEARRFGRGLYRYRLATLGVVAFLLPLLVPLAPGEAIALAMIVPGALAWWGLAARWIGAFPSGPDHRRMLAFGCFLEALAISMLVAAYGGGASPFMLLYLPLGVQAAGGLAPAGAALVAGFMAAGAVAALQATSFPWPVWALLPAAAAVLWGAQLGWWVLARRRMLAAAGAAARGPAALRRLMARAIAASDQPSFWSALARAVARDGEFAAAAIVRWPAGEPEVQTAGCDPAWRGLVGRHDALLRLRALSRTPEVFAEDGATGRAIVAWPIPGRGGKPGPGLLCVLLSTTHAARRVPTPAQPATVALGLVHRRLGRWLPLAGLALAASAPQVPLRRAPVDWPQLVDAVVTRLQGRLSGHLVMVDVVPGAIAADGALLVEAVAAVVEAALADAPRGSHVRLTVRPEAGAWRFEVETDATDDAHALPSPQLKLAKDVVAAHGGRWESAVSDGRQRRGFVLREP